MDLEGSMIEWEQLFTRNCENVLDSTKETNERNANQKLFLRFILCRKGKESMSL